MPIFAGYNFGNVTKINYNSFKMNISLINNDAVSGVVKLEIEKKDYAELVDKKLRQYRQKANVPGFRTGMVPLGLIKKMYGKPVMAEEINKLVSEGVYKFIQENELQILGEPLPNQTEQQEIDFDVQEDFDFYFDLAFAPVIQFKLNKRDRLNRYAIIVDEEMIHKQIESYRQHLGSYDQMEEVAEEDLVKGIATELEDGKPKEGGIVVEEAILMPKFIKEKQEQDKFVGAKLNTTVVFNPHKAFDGVAAEMASFLKVNKDVTESITADFQFEIKEITRYKAAELNREFFEKVFEGSSIETEEEFKEKIKASLTDQLQPQCEYKFMQDVHKLLIKKAGDVKFADDVLKRWLLVSNKKTTPEQVEEDYPKVMEDLIYHLTKSRIIKENELKVEDADVEELAKNAVRAQFAQYGMLSVPDNLLEKYTNEMLQKEESLQGLVDRALDDKLAKWVSEQVKVETKAVTLEEFEKKLT